MENKAAKTSVHQLVFTFVFIYAKLKAQRTYRTEDWLPLSRDEMEQRGWDRPDIIIVSGDAYVDHPAFGHAMIGRLAESRGFKVAILAQPNWRDDLRDFKKLGTPRYFFGVTAGCMDSMINHYTAFRRLRSDDAYTPGNKAGFRPDYASVVYTSILKKLYPDVPVVLGGVEASLRRFTHYDYWQDTLKPSVLFDAPADLLIYGNGIMPLLGILEEIKNGRMVSGSMQLRQTAFISSDTSAFVNGRAYKVLPSHEECLSDKKAFAESFRMMETESNKMNPCILLQEKGGNTVVVLPPYPAMSALQIDQAYNLPYTRLPHPRYQKRGRIAAWEMIRHSVSTHAGCFGGCSFCSISAHQGKFISSRSASSVLKEVEEISRMHDFSGYVSDLGGPSANMYAMKGIDESICMKCSRYSCIYPKKCSNLNDDHKPLLELYRKAASVKGVKKIFISSGIRYDMLLGKTSDEDKNLHCSEYLKQLIIHHVSGRLKVAPEHTSEKVLKLMRKPSFALYRKLHRKFYEICSEAGLNQQIVPYFISSHPGSTSDDMAELAGETRKLGLKLEQVQDFTPTPMTLSSVMFYTGIDPYSGEKIFSVLSIKEKKAQNDMFFWYKNKAGNKATNPFPRFKK